MVRIKLIFTLLLVFTGTACGQEWQGIEFPVAEHITGIEMISADTGFVVTAGGNFLSTKDGGKNWEITSVCVGVKLESLCFLNRNVGWVCGLKGSIYSTVDGGKTWYNQSWKDTSSMFIDIEFMSKDTGIAAGMRPDTASAVSPLSIRTTDGGKSWKPLNSMGMAYSEIRYEKTRHKLSLMSMGRMNTSTDGGNKWKSIYTIEGSPARTFSLYDAAGIMAGPKGVCAYSADSGKSWYMNKRGETEHFVSSVLVDSKRGYIAGLDGMMLSTQDGGRTWQPETLPWAFYVMDMFAIGNKVFAVGTDGSIISKTLELSTSRLPASQK
ncbi:MAG TPA: hypothetical protein VHP63_02815 [candidate division Zixibacteria bacterium]|nr:hypothetical protein [candidate division Zixibacteria bacterium]